MRNIKPWEVYEGRALHGESKLRLSVYADGKLVAPRLTKTKATRLARLLYAKGFTVTAKKEI